MKKYNIFKVLLLVLAAAIIVSFLIPSSTIGYYTSGIEKGTINPINFVDSISNGLTSFSVFISAFIFIQYLRKLVNMKQLLIILQLNFKRKNVYF